MPTSEPPGGKANKSNGNPDAPRRCLDRTSKGIPIFPVTTYSKRSMEKTRKKKRARFQVPRPYIKTRHHPPNAQGPKIPQTQNGTTSTVSETQLCETSFLDLCSLIRFIQRLRPALGIVLAIDNHKAESRKIRGKNQSKNNPRGKESCFPWEPARLSMRL